MMIIWTNNYISVDHWFVRFDCENLIWAKTNYISADHWIVENFENFGSFFSPMDDLKKQDN